MIDNQIPMINPKKNAFNIIFLSVIGHRVLPLDRSLAIETVHKLSSFQTALPSPMTCNP